MALTDLGFSVDQELLYRSLLRNPHSTVEQLALETGLARPQIEADCAALITLGVLRPAEGGTGPFVVPKPAAVISQLIEHQEDDLLRRYRRASETRSVIGELDQLFAAPGAREHEDHGVERMEDVNAIRDRLEELSFFTRSSIYAIQPGGPLSPEALDASRPLDQRSIRRGVKMRLIHESQVLADELNRAYLRELVMGGVKVRVTDQHIDRMIIMDCEVAVVPVDPTNGRRGALIVRHPGLLSGFLDLFHRTWEDARELPWHTEDGDKPAPGSEISAQDHRILELLASGCTDETSAREVGVSVRHLRRTISRLMQELGANSRFEAGVEATRRGWL